MTSLWSAEHPPEMINLGKGHPNPKLLPLDRFRTAFQTMSTRESAAVNMMQYGRMQGNEELCGQLSSWIRSLSPHPEKEPTPAEIMITAGAGPAMTVVCQLFTKRGDVIFVDSPAYFLSFYTFRDCGLKVVEVPTDSDGLSVEEVERRLKNGERPSILYTVPIANNPTGVSMSEERKRRLVELSREYNFKIASDEVYQLLSFSDSFPTSLFYYDSPEKPTVIAVNSFSKLLGPGLRVGWLSCREPLMKRLLNCGALQSGGGFNPATSATISEMFSNGSAQKHVSIVREHYRTTCQILLRAVEEHMKGALKEGETLTYERPTGGFFVFIRLPERFDADRLLEICQRLGVVFFVGKHSSLDKQGFRNCIRLCFAWLEPEVMIEGVKRIAKGLREY